jgi:hypothetical protein
MQQRRPARRLTRRSLVGAVGTLASFASGLRLAPARAGDSPAGPAVPVKPFKFERERIGVRAYDPARAFNGYTLFTPLLENRTVYLIDMEGTVVHTWQMPFPAYYYGYLTERGTLFYTGRVPLGGAGVVEMDWDGNVLLEVAHPDLHHEARLLPNGNVLMLCETDIPREVAARVRGGNPATEDESGTMTGDYVVEVTPQGQELWRWNSWEHLDPQEDAITAVQDTRSEWTHGNAVHDLPNGDIVVSFRNISAVAIVERPSGKIVWKLGAPPLAQQHAPTPLENGNLLIFDNGVHRLDYFLPYSRVIEVELDTQDIVWEYKEADRPSFFSPLISNAQRLPNGNTLICEGSFGRFFEVTHGGDVVWEYLSPYLVGATSIGSNEIFRAYRYSAEEIERARAVGSRQ